MTAATSPGSGPDAARPDVSITIVVYRSAETLAACLDSLAAVVKSGVAELIVVDNASPDHSLQVVRAYAPGAKLVKLSHNRGFAAGCNAAWPYVHGRYWLLLNPDVVIPPGGLTTLTRWLDQHPRLGVASPELADHDGRRESPGRAYPSAAKTLIEIARVHKLLPSAVRGRLLRGPYWPGGDQLGADWVPGAAMFVRREAVEQAGLLDERFFMYGEDIEWCWRIQRAGWGVGVCASTAFRHQAGASANAEWGERERSRRMAQGADRATRSILGTRRARAAALATAVALRVEAADPRRPPESRRRAALAYRAWAGLAVRRRSS